MEEESAATLTVNRFQLDRHDDLDHDDVESVGGEEGADSSEAVTYHVYDRSLHSRMRRALVRSPKARMSFAFLDFALRVAICLLYLVRLLVDDPKTYFCHGGPAKVLCDEFWNESMPMPAYDNTYVSWYVLLWVQRPLPVYIVQLVLSLITLIKTLFSIYVAPRGHRLKMVWTVSFWVEVLVSFPYLITLCYPPLLRDIYIPSFLNCWLAKKALQKIFIDLHMTRQKFQTISVTMYQQIILLVASLMCLIFTTVCGIEHLQRASYSVNLTLWQSFYFTIVTFSTVGYGDISPDIWPSELFMVIMICVAFAIIPRQLEAIVVTFVERQKEGPEYSKRAASRSKHVVVCSSFFTLSAIMDFLSEFYAHPKFEEHVVILLCPRELDNGMQVILKDPKWAHRVIYMRGSPGKDTDLKRCRIQQAEACFLLAHRACSDKAQADQHTVLRSWAVKDFAPNCKQYIQLFHAKNKMHIPFAEHVVCEDEFKFALLAHNCLYPGLSTLVALLVHTSAELVDSLPEHLLSDKWQKLYGRHSGNELYHIQLQKSIFFQQFKGRPFSEASAEAHNLFGVTLVAVLDPDAREPRLLLNPGPQFLLQRQHYCFYLATQREEHARIDRALVDQALLAQDGRPGVDFNRNHIEKLAAVVKRHHPSFSVTATAEDDDDSVISVVMERLEEEEEPPSSGDEADREVRHVGRFHVESPSGETTPIGKDTGDPSRLSPSPSQASSAASQKYGVAPVEISMADGNVWIPKASLTTGPLPVTIATGSRMTVCHIMGKPRDLCCLEWGVHCQHCRYKNASDNRWKEQLVLLAAKRASSGVYNFIIPLRSNFIDKESLQPIILLLEEQPSQMFLETIAQFPLVYWMLGIITDLDDLLKAGINKASHIVVVNRENSPDAEEEETLSDSQTVLAVQTIFKMFPNANVITELSQASNMRFMHFRGHDKYCQKISRLEQKLKETMPSTLSHIFRLPFAAGHVFSASMLDTLLYQTFVKGYLITFVRLLLGMDAEKGSGHLSSIQISREKAQQCSTYGDLYRELCDTTGEIPIGIYRSQLQGLVTLEQKRETIRRVSTVAAHTLDKGVDDNTAELIRSRLCSLDIDAADYQGDSKHAEMISFVICNPTANRSLKAGDIVYVIQPSAMTARPSKPHWWMHPRGRSRPPRRDGDRRGSWPFNHVEGTLAPTPEVDPEEALLAEPEPALPVSHHTICGEFLRDPRERSRALDELFSDPQDKEDPQSPKSDPGEVGRSSTPTPGPSGKPSSLQKVPPLKLPAKVLGDQGEEDDDDSTSSGTFSMSPRRDSGVYDPDSQWEEGERSPVKARSMSAGTASSGCGGSGDATSPGRNVPPVWMKNVPVGNGTGSVLPARGVDGKGGDGRQRKDTGSSQYTSNESLDSAPLLRRPATSPGAVTPAGKGTQPPQFEDTRC